VHRDRHFDWFRFHADERHVPPVVDSRRRVRICLAAFLVLVGMVFGRVVQLEVSQGAAFREEAARPLTRRRHLPGVRGRILAGNGAVLAYDKKTLALAVHYRRLEDPPNPRWLRRQAREKLSRTERKDPQRVAAEEARVRAEGEELGRRLARLCGLSAEQWNRRRARIQARVERIAETVNRRHRTGTKPADNSPDTPPDSLVERLGAFALEVLRASMDDSTPQRITVAEELDYHVIVEDLPLAVVAEVEADPQRYPGVRILQRRRRAYPGEGLAAHLLGHLGPVTEDELQPPPGDHPYRPEDRLGRMGLEQQYEHLLRGRPGVLIEQTDRGGRILSSFRQIEPGIGRDLVLCLNPPLQQAAETLLQSALDRRVIHHPDAEPAGGAILVLDVDTGAILAAASAPGFDPNLFAGTREAELQALFSNPAHPLFDRVAQMAIPPGSVFKTVSAAALLQAAAVDPREPFFCQGYLDEPDRWRCAIYRRHGTGHGEVTLADALAESCNVYFFHHAGKLGPGPLVDWARRFGFGRPTGVDLPGEAAGTLPDPSTIRRLEGHAWRTADTRALAIGQSALQATPLQAAVMMAAVANGGQRVTPHLASGLGLPELADDQSTADLAEIADDPIRIPTPRPIPGLDPATLATIREGLTRVVADPRGTAHGTVFCESIAIAGKTGTAQTGADRADHAWFAGYVPAEQPKLAFVVVLEHAGDAAEAAGPVAKRLVLAMQQSGVLGGRRW